MTSKIEFTYFVTCAAGVSPPALTLVEFDVSAGTR